uniref:Arm_2 domain-containing protein n=1 Tax=Mesocestoides corti TaxID=53468 RepID=A0A5K3G2G0_MESCO
MDMTASRKVIEDELYDLSMKAGVYVDRKMFPLLLNLINMNCNPSVIFYMLKQPLGHFARDTGSNVPTSNDSRRARSSRRDCTGEV